ncbi:MAG: chalcone isomerase family protein [Sutterellaceae bacterium]|nr:chalcone isomerase family protein [Burkholderiaceae bacterium]MCX7900808.1 chalcone isomerase family protein [Burkholderiaceae bacterium]MDW8430485.1 chalcone isomerase family protein [Sutterellaceae bacterium]
MTRLLAAGALWGATAVAQPVIVEGVRFEPTVRVAEQTLHLNGAGLRTRGFFKVYAAALYVPERSSAAMTLLAQSGARRVVITLLRDVHADTFAGSLLDTLKANVSEAQLTALQPQIEQLINAFRAAGVAKRGDTIVLDYTPQVGTRIAVNGQVRGDAIGGAAFFTALLRIWLGDRPVDEALKRALLGG